MVRVYTGSEARATRDVGRGWRQGRRSQRHTNCCAQAFGRRQADVMQRRNVVIRRLTFLLLAAVLALGIFIASSHWQVNAATGQSAQSSEGPSTPDRASGTAQRYGRRASERRPPGPAIDPYVRPEFAAEMRTLRPAILAAAQRHNRPQLSGMSDHDFAVVIALLMYNEHFGWFEERVRPVQALTPFYEDLQRQTNEAGFANLSVWPANIRPSVALEILRQQVPLPSNTGTLTAPIVVDGSRVRPDRYSSLGALYAAIT